MKTRSLVVKVFVALCLLILIGMLKHNDVTAQSGYIFPAFKAPYAPNSGVAFTGGPHAWGSPTSVVTIPIEDGSGLDFALDGNPFEVRAMASGTVVELRRTDCTSGEYDLGCKIAIKHDVGGTVLIYGHLAEGSIPSGLQVGSHVSQADPLGIAGNTESVGDVIHLHVELRTGQACSGTRHCYVSTRGEDLGDPLNWGSWGQVGPRVDGFWIVNYAVYNGDDVPTHSYNYDGLFINTTISPILKDVYDYSYQDYNWYSEDDIRYPTRTNVWVQLPGDMDCSLGCREGYPDHSAVRYTGDGNFTGGAVLPSTNSPSIDQTPPNAYWNSPSNNSTINSSTVTLRVTANDSASGVNRVNFSAKYGGAWHSVATDYSSPYEFYWDMCAAGVPDGDVELGVEAWDNAGNVYIYSQHYTNYHITKSYNCGSSPPPPSTGEVKLYNQANFGGDPFWTGGVGNHSSINPLQFTYSIEMPSGWSVITYGDYNFTGAEHCWSGSEDKLQDHGWTAEAKSLRVYSSNVCPESPPPGTTWEAKFWRTGTCYDDHSQCDDSNTTHQTSYGVPGRVDGRDYIIKEDWGTGSPGGSTPNDEFTGYFRATINFPAGNYVFYSTNDDGLKFKIPGYGEYSTSRDNREDNQQMCSGDGQSYYLSGNKTLEAYLIERGGDATIQIWYDNNTDACNPPVLLWPGNGSTITVKSPTFDWESKEWDPQYSIKIDGTDYTTSSSSYTPPTPLAYGTHTWQVRARNPYGGEDSPCSAERQFTIQPPVPTSIYASDGTYLNKVRLTWATVDGATGYQVYRATSYGGTKTNLGSPAGTVFDDTTATKDITYYYWVKACVGSVCGNYSNYDTGWHNGSTPVPPTYVQASDGTYTNKINISWIASSGATRYEVWRNTADNTSTAMLLSSSVLYPESQYDDTNVTPGITYYYWVKACNNNGCSDFSASNSGYRGVPPPPNDDFGAAQNISAMPYTASQSTIGATTAVDDPTFACLSDQRYNSVWYQYTPSDNGVLSVNTFGSTYDTVLAVWSGTRGALQSEGCNDDTGAATQSELEVTLAADTTYYIEVAGYSSTAFGTLNLSASFEIIPLCETVTEIPQVECEVLETVYNSTDGPSWTDNSNWLVTNTPCGDWYGVYCDAGHVVQLSLENNQLSGTIPSELGNLLELKWLYFQENQLSGTIPSTLGNLDLRSLYLYDNQLSGTIPSSLGNLSNLYFLDLGTNQLEGNIPPRLGDLANLEWLSLRVNQLDGPIPSQLGNLSNLTYLNLRSNQLDGSIPPQLGNLANLEYLYLYENELSGNIPAELGNLVNLQRLSLRSNQLEGSIPWQLGNLSNLTYLNLRSNQLSGSIPPQLGNLANLEELYLYYNQLSGNIPPELGNLSSLQSLDMSFNQLSGPIPPQLGNLTNLQEYLYLTANQLSGPIPSELGNLVNLKYLLLGGNPLTGTIPPELGNMTSLESLTVNYTSLEGELPQSLTNLSSLNGFWFDNTNVCEPTNATLQSWLANIDYLRRSGITCGIPIVNNVLINEVDVGDPDWVELYNPGTAPVDISGWHLHAYASSGAINQDYVLPSFVLQPDSYVVLHETAGTNSATDLYFDANISVWVNDGSGSVVLKTNTDAFVDSVRWGGNVVASVVSASSTNSISSEQVHITGMDDEEDDETITLYPESGVVLHDEAVGILTAEECIDANTCLWVDSGINVTEEIGAAHWIEPNPPAPPAGRTLGRITSVDTDTRDDWAILGPTPGRLNGTGGNVYLPIILRDEK